MNIYCCNTDRVKRLMTQASDESKSKLRGVWVRYEQTLQILELQLVLGTSVDTSIVNVTGLVLGRGQPEIPTIVITRLLFEAVETQVERTWKLYKVNKTSIS